MNKVVKGNLVIVDVGKVMNIKVFSYQEYQTAIFNNCRLTASLLQ